MSKPNWEDLQAATEEAKKELGADAPTIALLKRSRQLLGGMEGRRLERERLAKDLVTGWSNDTVNKNGRLYVSLPEVLKRIARRN